MNRLRLLTGTLVITAGFAGAQTTQRKAAIVGGGNADSGKCTVEVTVDGSAQVEVRGDNGTLRNTGGQAPQWRRFECTGAMPGNPANFRFAGVDGRGRQTLARDPRNNGGTALVEISDSDNGSEGYTFDLFWGNQPAVTGGFRNDGPGRGSGPANRPDERGFGGGQGPRDRRMSANEAMDICQRSIKDQAASQFRTPNITLQNVSVDNNPGRNDWILGEVAVRRRFGRPNIYRFTCSVNFDTGNVRSTHIDQFEQNTYKDPNRR